MSLQHSKIIKLYIMTEVKYQGFINNNAFWHNAITLLKSVELKLGISELFALFFVPLKVP